MLSKLYWLIDLCWLLIINLLTWIWLLQQETPETRKLLWPLSSVSWCLKAEMEMGFMFLYFAEHLLKLYWDFFLTIKAIKWEVKLWNCIPNQMLNFVAFCFGSKYSNCLSRALSKFTSLLHFLYEHVIFCSLFTVLCHEHKAYL